MFLDVILMKVWAAAFVARARNPAMVTNEVQILAAKFESKRLARSSHLETLLAPAHKDKLRARTVPTASIACSPGNSAANGRRK
jgi:hypothetical protein